MQYGPPRQWQLTPDSSPLPVPEQHWYQDSEGIIGIEMPEYDSEEIDLDGLLSLMANSELSDGRNLRNEYDFSSCRAMLVLGELANPYRLNDIGISNIVILNVRIEGLCRVWADSIDSREVNPGVHHVTLARTKGWWEKAWLAIAPLDKLKKMVDWLDGGARVWLPKTLKEGVIRLEDGHSSNPGPEEINWDGKNMNGESVTSGIYFCLLKVNDKSLKSKIVLLK